MDIDVGHGYTATIDTEQDSGLGMPWKEHDGHGPVSEWTRRDPAPGERVLCEDRGNRLLYDFAGAVALAKNDGWDTPPYGTGTKDDRAVRAANADFEHLRKWCAGDWGWIGVIVTVSRDGAEVGSDSLWGIESCGEYWREEGERMARYIAESDIAGRHNTWRAALKEARERKACAHRDILTV